jgi:hypothetical protein
VLVEIGKKLKVVIQVERQFQNRAVFWKSKGNFARVLIIIITAFKKGNSDILKKSEDLSDVRSANQPPAAFGCPASSFMHAVHKSSASHCFLHR